MVYEVNEVVSVPNYHAMKAYERRVPRILSFNTMRRRVVSFTLRQLCQRGKPVVHMDEVTGRVRELVWMQWYKKHSASHS